MYQSTKISSLFLAYSALVLAAPAPIPEPKPQWGGGSSSDPVCTEKVTYKVESVSPVYDGYARLVSGTECEANAAGCTLSHGQTYSVTTTISVGVDLGLDLGEIFKTAGASVGVSGGYSVATGEATSITEAVSCPIGCTCGLSAIAKYRTFKGTQIREIKNAVGPDSACVGESGSSPYVVVMPVIKTGTVKGSEAAVTYSACKSRGISCPSQRDLTACPAVNHKFLA